MKKIKRAKKTMESPETDPMGSYTGVVTLPCDGACEDMLIPEQDADDL